MIPFLSSVQRYLRLLVRNFAFLSATELALVTLRYMVIYAYAF